MYFTNVKQFDSRALNRKVFFKWNMSSKIVTVENLTNIRTTIIIHIFNFIVCLNFKGQKISKANYLVSVMLVIWLTWAYVCNLRVW